MGYPEDLLEQSAFLLEGWRGNPPNQAGLRRSVSTAYYALFHLLIEDAVSIWPLRRHRDALSRTVEHRSIKKAFANCVSKADKGSKLRGVAQAFTELQEKRHTADYDNSHTWTLTSAEALFVQAVEAVDTWRTIRHEEKVRTSCVIFSF